MRSFRTLGAACVACACSLTSASLAQHAHEFGPSVLSPNSNASYQPYGSAVQPRYPMTSYAPAYPSTAQPAPSALNMATSQPAPARAYDQYQPMPTHADLLGQPPAIGSSLQFNAYRASDNLVNGGPEAAMSSDSPPTQQGLWKHVGSNKCGGSCVKCGHGNCCCLWFGGIGGLAMTRDDGDHYNFSYGTGNEADQRTNTRDAAMDWSFGFDARAGRYFNCGRNAIEVVYWGIYPDSESTRTTSADVLGNLNGILNWDALDYGGAGADTIVNVAPAATGVHALSRDFEFHNAEINLWHLCGSCGLGKCGCSSLRYNWLAGFRYLRFSEDLLFAADANDTAITGEDDELFYGVDVDNNLYGFQVGAEAQYCCGRRWTFDLGMKMGVFNNRIDHLSQIGGNLGAATINNGPFAGQDFYVDSSKNDVAFLAELDLGLEYCLHRNWTAIVGYRAVAVSGVALPADQIYSDLRGINDVAVIDSNGSLLLHGAYAGLEFNW